MTELNITIDKHIPLASRSKYPFEEMALGDSFFVPGRTISQMSAVSCAASRRTKHKYSCRSRRENATNGIRVWRVA